MMKPPADAEKFGNSHYKFFMTGKTAHEAAALCRRMGGHLAVITNKKEHEFVANLAKRNRWWLGGNKEGLTQRWHWVTGEAFRYSKWSPEGHEGKNPGQDYMILHEDGFWHDVPASSVYYFICEWD
ncbi:MAG: C-type lectin domain-containing protein [Verrucomicrobiota bacterium]